MNFANYQMILGLFFVLGLCACEEEPGLTAEDHFLNYEVPVEPVQQDYLVGATYTYTNFTNNVSLNPLAGRYPAASAEAYARHLEDAKQASIDFFLFSVRGSHNLAQFQQDSTRLASLLAVDGAEQQGFAIAYDIRNFNLNNNARRIESAPGMLVNKFIGDIRRLGDAFFSRSNYTEAEGKKILYLTASHNLFATDNMAVYQQLRDALAADGFELYLIGEQPAWTPPRRYDFRFEGSVDAVSQPRYVQITNGFYNRYELFENIVDQAWQYNKDIFAEQSLAYIPQVSPSFDRRIQAPASKDFVFERDNGDFFMMYANLARRAATSPVVIIDSFNDFKVDNQIEPTEEYGTRFLDLVRESFKLN